MGGWKQRVEVLVVETMNIGQFLFALSSVSRVGYVASVLDMQLFLKWKLWKLSP